MTIHSTHPFATPEPDRDQVRRLRGRLGGAVSLWTSGEGAARAGLTVSSLMVAGGEPGRVLALLDPDEDLTDRLSQTGAAVVHLLAWRHRGLAEAFGGTAPAPGGPFRMAEWDQVETGPRLRDAPTWAEVRLESMSEVGWSMLATCSIVRVSVGDDDTALEHRRGRWGQIAAD